LATTSQPSSSNLLVSNGGAGVYGVATTSASCSGGLTCSGFTVLGSSPVTLASFDYPFPGNATSTTLTFNAGLLSVGSTTLNGNATTTGTFYASIASSSQTYGSFLSSCTGGNNAL